MVSPVAGAGGARKSFASAVLGDRQPPGKVGVTFGEVRGFPAVFISDEDMRALARPFALTLVGKFSVCRPPLEVIRAFVVRLKFLDKVLVDQHDRFHVSFRFSDERDYCRFFAKRFFRVFGTNMQVLKWSPFSDLCEVLPIIPLWVSFPGLRYQLFHSDTLLDIASVFGKSLRVDSSTVALGNLSCARVLVEVDISIPHPDQVWIGSLHSGFLQKVVIEGMPSFCELCRGEGHVSSSCALPRGGLSAAAAPSGSPIVAVEPVVFEPVAGSGTPQVALDVPLAGPLDGSSAPLQGSGSTSPPPASSVVLVREDGCCPPGGLGPILLDGGVLGPSGAVPSGSGTPQVALDVPLAGSLEGSSAPPQGSGSTSPPSASTVVLFGEDGCCPPGGSGSFPLPDPDPDPDLDPGPSLVDASCLIPLAVVPVLEPVLALCTPDLGAASLGGSDFVLEPCAPSSDILLVGGGCGGLKGEDVDSDGSVESIVMEPWGGSGGRVLPSSFRLESSAGNGPGSLALGVPLRGITTRSMSRACTAPAASSSGSFRGGGSGGKSKKKRDKIMSKKRYEDYSAMAGAFAALFKPPDFSA